MSCLIVCSSTSCARQARRAEACDQHEALLMHGAGDVKRRILPLHGVSEITQPAHDRTSQTLRCECPVSLTRRVIW